MASLTSIATGLGFWAPSSSYSSRVRSWPGPASLSSALGSSPRSPAGGSRAIAGVVLIVLGGLVALSGLVGLGHKLIADAVMVGTAAAAARDTSITEDTPADETSSSDASETAASAAAAGEAAGGDGGATAGQMTASEPADSGPTSATDDATDPSSSDPAPGDADPASDPASADQSASDAQPASETDALEPTASDESPDQPSTAEPASAEGHDVDEGAAGPAGDDPTEADQSVTDLEAEDFQPKVSTEPADADDDTDDSVSPEEFGSESDTPVDATPGTDEPEEWTPPDPAEFETAGADESRSARDDPAPPADRDAGDGFGADNHAESVSRPRTAEDLFGDGRADGDTGGTDAGEADADADAGDLDDQSDDGQTLADEGMSGFQPASEKDPLSDTLDDE
ncbi:prolipoprotein diacylglyceryl transferase [Haloarcula regularis]|uniref:hypothetical protein n=1 Tax=Haloarcula regularis TaxID=3033392 RepID=UPI0023E7A4DB|nr:hypothetical protein [Halomicroarcula sp. SYNS111]